MKNVLDYTGKVALVTGAAAGMGLATARAFAEAGAAVVLADFREDLVKAEAKKLTDAGLKAIGIRCDVSDDAEVEKAVQQTVAEFGRLDMPTFADWLCCGSSWYAAIVFGSRPKFFIRESMLSCKFSTSAFISAVSL